MPEIFVRPRGKKKFPSRSGKNFRGSRKVCAGSFGNPRDFSESDPNFWEKPEKSKFSKISLSGKPSKVGDPKRAGMHFSGKKNSGRRGSLVMLGRLLQFNQPLIKRPVSGPLFVLFVLFGFRGLFGVSGVWPLSPKSPDETLRIPQSPARILAGSREDSGNVRRSLRVRPRFPPTSSDIPRGSREVPRHPDDHGCDLRRSGDMSRLNVRMSGGFPETSGQSCRTFLGKSRTFPEMFLPSGNFREQHPEY